VFGNRSFSKYLAILIIFVFLFGWIRKHQKSFSINRETLFKIFFIAVLLLAQCFVLFPFVRMQTVDGQPFISFGGIGDYFKHSYVITSLAENGVRAKHPFFPISDFKYYYGYYLIPSLLVSFCRQWQLVILSGYVLFTNALSYWLIKKVVDRHIIQRNLRWLVLALAVIGYSFDALSMIAGKLYLSMPWYQAWKIDLQAGFRVMTALQAAFWVPQHFLVAIFTLYLLSELLIKKKIAIAQIFGVSFFSILSSAFVSIYLAFSLALVFLFIPRHRKNIFIGGAMALIVLWPYLSSMVGKGTNLFSFYAIKSYPYFSQGGLVSEVLNWLITVVSQVGVLPTITFAALLSLRKTIGIKKLVFWSTLLFSFMIITLFLRSGGYNDFGMRSVLPTQIAMPIVLGVIVEHQKRSWKKIAIIWFMLISLVVALPGLVTETASAWKFRGVLGYDESRLMLHIRSLPKEVRLAAVGREEWIYKIPSMGFHSVLTNDFYDSAPYADPDVNHTVVEVSLKELFLDPATDNRLKNPAELIRVIEPLPFDQIILDENIYVKQGKNPWVIIFDKLEIPVVAKVGRYRFYDKKILLKLSEGRDIKLGSPKAVIAKEKTLSIGKGLWFIQACNKTNNHDFIYLDLEDYYTFLSISLDKNQCAGNYFYYDKDAPLRLSGQNKVKEVNVFPVLTK